MTVMVSPRHHLSTWWMSLEEAPLPPDGASSFLAIFEAASRTAQLG